MNARPGIPTRPTGVTATRTHLSHLRPHESAIESKGTPCCPTNSPPARTSARQTIATVDTIARELLNLGYLVRLHRSAAGHTALLFVSRSGFDTGPVTVHVLARHRLGLEVHPGVVVDVGDLDQLHHRLHDLHHPNDRHSDMPAFPHTQAAS